MRKKIIILVITILVILGLGIYGYFSAISGINDQAGASAKIKITPLFFDFGEIEYGEVVEHIFKVENLGNNVLEIKRVATSCACTTAKINQERINPNEESELIVTYNTGAMSGSHAKGQQERIIYLKSNDPINPQTEVTITAYVK